PFNRVGLRLGQKYPAVASAGTTPPTTAPTPAPEPAPSPTTPPEPAPQPAPEPAPTPTAEPEPTTVPGVKFSVHLASFGEKANADRSLAKLKAAGVPVFLSRIELDNKTWHRLMAGRFDTRAEAEAYGRQLKDRGLLKGLGEFMIKPIVETPDSG
ncbi:MAG: SPOR domain-containing protein, partial [Thermodesulfobacteriota bacterium]